MIFTSMNLVQVPTDLVNASLRCTLNVHLLAAAGAK